MKKELLEGLSEEQITKSNDCKSNEELLALAKEEGVELNSDQLEAVSGGACSGPTKCPNCGSDDTSRVIDGGYSNYYCYSCHHRWEVSLY